MKVYLLYKQVSNLVDYWETVLAVYKDETEAELAALELEEKEGSEYVTFFVKEFDLL